MAATVEVPGALSFVCEEQMNSKHGGNKKPSVKVSLLFLGTSGSPFLYSGYSKVWH